MKHHAVALLQEVSMFGKIFTNGINSTSYELNAVLSHLD